MANPFKQKVPALKPTRVNYDLSHSNHSTYQMGKLYPVLCQEVIPGDKFNIETTFGLRFMPLLFPVQSRMRADIHFFYVRNRNLWKDWPDFIGATKEGLIPPYIQTTDADMFRTGSLADHLGVPTTLAGLEQSVFMSLMTSEMPRYSNRPIPSHLKTGQIAPGNLLNPLVSNAASGVVPLMMPTDQSLKSCFGSSSLGYNQVIAGTFQQNCDGTVKSLFNTVLNPIYFKTSNDAKIYLNNTSDKSTKINYIFLYLSKKDKIEYSTLSAVFANSSGIGGSIIPMTIRLLTKKGGEQTLADIINDSYEKGYYVWLQFGTQNSKVGADQPGHENYTNIATSVTISPIETTNVIDANYVATPYMGANPAIKLSALPFRAYESIFNGFYRNQQNDPFKIGNTIEYNKFITNNNGGADTTKYDFFHRYYEQDHLTTAVPSPQQGVAPLVGARAINHGQTYQLKVDGDSGPETFHVRAEDTGDITAINLYSEDANDDMVKTLNEAISFGISINDFRNVNSLQRWLEKNVQRGFRYKDQIMSHFGVEVSYSAMDMPEFLGGVTENITVNQISQTVQTNSGVLGAYAGQAAAIGASKHSINRYFDEHGFIIAIMSISPIPSYSQLLPKHFTKFSHLDYYFPEFQHIGMQPITYRDVTPLQAFNEGKSLETVFGYQRPHWDYLSTYDRVHGQFRTTLRDFLVNRVFGKSPELGSDFLSIKPQDVNNIFAVQSPGEDTILGQIHFKINAKRPISNYLGGRLE